MKILKDSASNTTSHGLPNIVNSEYKTISLLWIIFLLASIVYCSYTIVESFFNYFEFNVDTSIQIVRESQAAFPAISICNHNPFNTKRSGALIKKLSAMVDKETSYSKMSATDPRIAAFYLQKGLKTIVYASNMSTEENDKYFGFTIEDMLIGCRFVTEECNASNFEWYHSYEFGNCYKYNSGVRYPLKTVSKPGWKNALQLEIFVGQDRKEDEYLMRKGLHIVVHNQSIDPVLEEEGVDISVGLSTNLVLQRTFYKSLSKPYSDCLENIWSQDSHDSELYRLTFTLQNLTQYRFTIFGKT